MAIGPKPQSAYSSPIVDMYEQLRAYKTEALESELRRRKEADCGPHLPRTDAGALSVTLGFGQRYISCECGRYRWVAHEVTTT